MRAGQLLDSTEATLDRTQTLLKAILDLDRTLNGRGWPRWEGQPVS